MNLIRKLLLIELTLLLCACASNVPIEIRQPVAGSPTLTAVVIDPRIHQGQSVRWGGTIARVENRNNETWIEIVARRLDAFGEPVEDDRSAGRFLARNDGFLDPQIYATGRSMTVTGTIDGTEAGKIGEQAYTFPLVRVAKAYLWPQRADWRDDPWCRQAYWRSSLFYRHRYPGLWHGYWLGYPFGYWDPFWGPYMGPGDCRW